MNSKIVLIVTTLVAGSIACLYTDNNLARFVIVSLCLYFLYITDCFGFSGDLKGRAMRVLEHRFNCEVRDESFHESDPDCEFSLYINVLSSIESVEDAMFAFFNSQGYHNSVGPIQTGATLCFYTEKDNEKLCVLINQCVVPENEIQIRVGPVS